MKKEELCECGHGKEYHKLGACHYFDNEMEHSKDAICSCIRFKQEVKMTEKEWIKEGMVEELYN